MSDELQIAGKTYISSKRAAKISGYAQDYIGQLARSSSVDARRVGGLWYIEKNAMELYKGLSKDESDTTDTDQSSPNEKKPLQHDSMVSFDGKDYISSYRASEITGYNQDYIGQLARNGTVLARQVSSRWFIDRDGLLAHKKEKDELLAAVQASSVGIQKIPTPQVATATVPAMESSPARIENIYTYKSENNDLIPILKNQNESTEINQEKQENNSEIGYNEDRQTIPIRVLHQNRPDFLEEKEIGGTVLAAKKTSLHNLPVLSLFKLGAFRRSTISIVLLVLLAGALISGWILVRTPYNNAYVLTSLESMLSRELIYIRK